MLTGRHAVLLALQRAHVFDPVPLRAGLHSQHVPFDQLTGGAGTEAALIRCLRGAERVAVAGRTGVGKTSLIGYACAQLAHEVAPMRVPVDAEDDETITDPAAFCRHLIRTLARHLAEARSIDDRTRASLLAGSAETVGLSTHRSRHGGVGLPRWMLQLEVARDVEIAATATVQRSGSEHIAQACDVIAAVAARGLIPAVVIDDSDAWLATAVGDRRGVIRPFFGRVVRVLAEELEAAVVVAVHDHYFEVPEFPRGRGFLEQVIAVPALPDRRALEAILDSRTTTSESVAAAEVFTPAALRMLFDGYQLVEHNIRTTLLLAHTALQVACEDEAAVITPRHLQVALTRYRDVPG